MGVGFNVAAQLSEGTFDTTSGKTWARMGGAAGAGFGMAYVPESWAAIPTIAAASGAVNVADQVIRNG